MRLNEISQDRLIMSVMATELAGGGMHARYLFHLFYALTQDRSVLKLGLKKNRKCECNADNKGFVKTLFPKIFTYVYVDQIAMYCLLWAVFKMCDRYYSREKMMQYEFRKIITSCLENCESLHQFIGNFALKGRLGFYLYLI